MFAPHFSRKHREGFLAKKNASLTDTTTLTQHNTYTAHTHHATVYTNIHHSHTPRDSPHRHTPRNRMIYAGHIHYAAAFASLLHDTTPTPSITCTAHLHRATAFAHIAFTSPFIFSFFKAGVGSSGIVGAHPLRVSCASHRSHCGAVRIFHMNSEPSAGIARVESLPLRRRANRSRRRRTLCGFRARRIAIANHRAVFGGRPRWRVKRLANLRK